MLPAVLAFLSLAAAVDGSPKPRAEPPRCRAIPGGGDWPSLETWAKLNATVEGRLIEPVPPAAICHKQLPQYNRDGCMQVIQSWRDEWFHSEDPVSVEFNNWNNETCLPIAGAKCERSGYPAYVIDATTPAHVKAGVDFAREHNIRLIVKSSGHDFIGRSSGGNSLSIWVHRMKGTTLHEESFSPKSCNVTIKGAAMTVLGGSQMTEIYSSADSINHVPLGANGRSVAIGGFITGGGHSIIGPQYGMAGDHVLEMEVVTPMGEILTLNECQNTDLFWAIRGGGASTFGVVTSVTMSIFPSPKVLNMDLLIVADAASPHVFDMVAYVVGQFPALMQAGVSGYPLIIRDQTSQTNERQKVSGIVGKLIMLDTDKPADMMKLLNPIFAHINATWPGSFFYTVSPTTFPSFYAWYEKNFDPSPSGYNAFMASRLLDADALSKDATATKMALDRFAHGDQTTVFIVSGPAVWDAKPRGGGNAINPAWRKAVVHATTTVRFTFLNEAEKADALARSNSYVEGLKDLDPDSGAYLNEAGPAQPNWRHEFWGENYARLLEIKRRIDPDDVLWCTPCVGNERWEEVNGQLCRVSDT